MNDELNQLLMCFEKHIYSELGESYPVKEQKKLTRKEVIERLQAWAVSLAPEKKTDLDALWSSQQGNPLTYNQAVDDFISNIEGNK